MTLGGALLPVAAAHAENPAVTSCHSQTRSFPTPGDDTSLTVKTCITWSPAAPDSHQSSAWISWTHGGDSAADGNRKFDALEVTIRLERYGRSYGSVACSFAGDINRNRSGSGICFGVTLNSTANGGWTGDGQVTYDLDRDGKGASTWQLTGSPQAD